MGTFGFALRFRSLLCLALVLTLLIGLSRSEENQQAVPVTNPQQKATDNNGSFSEQVVHTTGLCMVKLFFLRPSIARPFTFAFSFTKTIAKT